MKRPSEKTLRERAAFKAALAALEAAALSPYDLYAYATATDAFEYATEIRDETKKSYSIDDALEALCESDIEDAHHVIADFYAHASKMVKLHHGRGGRPL